MNYLLDIKIIATREAFRNGVSQKEAEINVGSSRITVSLLYYKNLWIRGKVPNINTLLSWLDCVLPYVVSSECRWQDCETITVRCLATLECIWANFCLGRRIAAVSKIITEDKGMLYNDDIMGETRCTKSTRKSKLRAFLLAYYKTK